MVKKQIRVGWTEWAGIVTCAKVGSSRCGAQAIRRRMRRAHQQRTYQRRVKSCGRHGCLIEEIDEVLEENAEEFVKNYVQRGGE